MPSGVFPRFQPVAERALLVEFGDGIDEGVHRNVLRLDAALAASPLPGFVEAVPAYASVLVVFDPMTTDHETAKAGVLRLLATTGAVEAAGGSREIEVCYDDGFAPDLGAVAERLGTTPETVVAAHLGGDYKVFMYGFAPGYAYLGGVPEAIRLSRKPAAVRGVPAGSVIIAGSQCLVTTIDSPTGWWVIGRSPTRVLDAEGEKPFLLDVGDRVRFRRVGADAIPPAAKEQA